MMTEDFFHYIWKFRLIDGELKTTEGELVTIIKPGKLNRDAGPDFFDARIKLDNTIWAGNIEVHVYASDWDKHGHQHDERYHNIILHVVYENDALITIGNRQPLPTLVLKGRFREALYDSYRKYMKRRCWVPCEKLFPRAESIDLGHWTRSLLEHRMNEKAAAIERTLIMNCLDWEQTIYQYLAMNFGFKVNSHAFELLAKSLPLQIIKKHSHNLFELEALLFGQAGFLNKEHMDEYHRRLRTEYIIFKKRYSLHPVDQHLWNFLRLRPANFPSIRIAQLAFLLGQSSSLFDLIIRPGKIKTHLQQLNAGTSFYWHTHYIFDKVAPKSGRHLGENSIRLLIINSIVPFNYVYGMINNKPSYVRKAMRFLRELPPESNQVISKWRSLNAPISSAYESQAFLQLKKVWCDRKRCLECHIGDHVLKDMPC
jgi:hypothetical protein